MLPEVRLPQRFRLLRQLFFLLKTILIGLHVRPNIVYAYDYFTALHGWISTRLTRAASVYNAHEFLPGIKERSGLRHSLFMLLQQLSIERCDLVIATGDERAQALRDYYGLR